MNPRITEALRCICSQVQVATHNNVIQIMAALIAFDQWNLHSNRAAEFAACEF